MYSFGQYVDDYLAVASGILAEETIMTRKRRYKRIERNLIELREQKKISTTSPKHLNVEDVRVFITDRRSKVSPSDVVQDVNALKKLCDFLENPAVGVCVSKYAGLRPVLRGNNRLPPMTDEMYDLILDRANNGIAWNSFVQVRAYALVLLYLETGARNKELRLANVNDLNTVDWTINFIHVKGEMSYGQPRVVPIRPEIRTIILRYLDLRNQWCSSNSVYSPALFPSKTGVNGGYLTSNGIRRIKGYVEKDLKIRFDLRQCRRTFGQRYMDRGLPLESTSLLMGHSSTKTTESFYSRRKMEYAIKDAVSTWQKVPGGQ